MSAQKQLRLRPAVASQTAGILVGLYLFFMTSRDFWPEALSRLGERPATLSLLAAGLACLFVAACVIFSWKKMMKPLLAALVLAVAGAVWLLDEDSPFRSFSDNAAGFTLHMLVFGAVPATLLLWMRVRHGSFFWQLRGNLAIAVPALAIALCVMATHLTDYISIAADEMTVADAADAGATVTVLP